MANENDFAKQMDELVKKLNELVPDIQKEIAGLSKEFLKELKKTHANETDPYGKPWKPRKDNLPHPILNKTGKMIKSYKAYPTKNGATIYNTAAYSGFHDQGTSRIPKRQMIPDIKRGIPETWMKLIQKRIDRYLKKKFAE